MYNIPKHTSHYVFAHCETVALVLVMPEPGRGKKIPLGIESGSEDIHDVPRVFLAQYHEKDMERLHHKLRQKQEETHKREEKRREEVEKVRSYY